MFHKKPLAAAISSILAVTITGAASAAVIEEVVVTATKRSTSTQDIAVTVQALGEQTIKDLNVGNFDDYMRYLPNVTAGGRGPGQSAIYLRGMATDTIAVHLSQANGSAPNVALYLDEQPVSVGGRNLDVYVTDVERIEVLPGPQGTLFGASSQAGTIRLITNKPKIDVFQAGLDASAASTKSGGLSNTQEAFINIPLIDGKLAVRGAFYNVQEAGYIDNTSGSFTPDPATSTFPENAIFEAATNTELVKKDFNDAAYQGFRLGAKYLINDNWDLLLQHSQQRLQADGVFDYDPEVGDLEVNRFFKDELDDEFQQTAWTLEGRLAMLDLVYTGAYLDREVDASIDYTGYNNSGNYVTYYTCNYNAPVRECFDPTKGSIGRIENTRETHELRISTPEQNRWRVVAGVFYEDIEVLDTTDWYYASMIDLGFPQNYPRGWSPYTTDPVKSTANDTGPRPLGVAFFNDITRTEEQLAFFGELEYDLVPQTLMLTLGLRRYDIEVSLLGSANSSFANSPEFTAGVDVDQYGANLDAVFAGHSSQTEKDTIGKVSLSWTPNNDMLFYATVSEGFRPPGYNRGGGNGNAETTVPFTYSTDTVENYEFGWKTTLAGGAVQFNGSIYFVDWTDIQVSVFNPDVYFLTYIDNAADAELKGIEGDLIWLATDDLTLNASFAITDSKLTKIKPSAVNVAPVGSELALAPDLQYSLRARYRFDIDQFQAYWQLGLQYADESYSSIVIVPNNRFPQKSYTTVDGSVGFGRDSWNLELFGENLTDERAELFINTQDDNLRTTTNRPRTIGLRVSYDI